MSIRRPPNCSALPPMLNTFGAGTSRVRDIRKGDGVTTIGAKPVASTTRNSSIMTSHGYREDEIDHVVLLLKKEQLKKDKESQALENVVAVVFLEHYFGEFLSKHDHYSDDKIVDIIGKTLRKMSPKGHSAALALALPKRTRKLVEAALAREAPVLEKLAIVAID